LTPTITILLPVHNGLPFIKETINSVFSQTFKNWELLISDNASTDGTREYLLEIKDERIRIFTHNKNIGLARNWDFLLQLVNTKYLCVIGADDIFLPNHLEKKIALLESCSELALVHGNVITIDEESLPLNRAFVDFDQIETHHMSAVRLLELNFVNITSVVFSTEALRAFDLRFEVRYQLMIDWAILLKFSILGGLMIFDYEPTVQYRVHNKSTTKATLNSFSWHLESIALRIDSLMEHTELWERLNINSTIKARLLSKRLWTVALRQFILGNWNNSNRAWSYYRKYHSLVDIISDFMPYLVSRLNRIFLK
jgi:glycosyltransferase involved in cell wall biosynthesis